jgi:hypothetical protein
MTTVLKEAQEKFRNRFSSYDGRIEYLQAVCYKDSDALSEKLCEDLLDRLEYALELLDGVEAPRWNQRETFDQAVKLVYLMHRLWDFLELYLLEHPEHKAYTDYLLNFAIRSGDAIFYIAPEYNELLNY